MDSFSFHSTVRLVTNEAPNQSCYCLSPQFDLDSAKPLWLVLELILFQEFVSDYF